MLLDLIVFFVVLFVTPDAARGLSSTAPAYLDEDSARQHLAAAVVAGLMTRTKPETLLAISWHESRYKYDVITSEPPDPRTGQARWSCGVLTPEPITDRQACEEIRSNLALGYLVGARHLRAWLDVCRDHSGCALLGYAGAATHDCANTPTAACVAAKDFAMRSMWIKRALRPAKSRAKPPLS
jgi:hypothetical protein